MKVKSFKISNFKGVNSLTLNFDDRSGSGVYCLVGLNESGKTSVLEAINQFEGGGDALDALNLTGYKLQAVESAIPVGKISNFNGSVEIQAELELNEDNIKSVIREVKKECGSKITDVDQKVTFGVVHSFSKSKYIKSSKWILTQISGKKKTGKIIRDFDGDTQEWSAAARAIMKAMPEILYFPNFLFDFPDKIYLERGYTKENEFYLEILQDLLDALNNKTSVDEHIIGRLNEQDSDSSKRSLHQLLFEMQRHVTETVFAKWNNVFQRKLKDKIVKLDLDRDDKGHYLSFQIEDSDGLFDISTRSLGFRWFFVFLLLTEYRGRRSGDRKQKVFLFDEPASNLHPNAQQQMLTSFAGLADKDSIVLYTTHSHYMILPEWLGNTCVIENLGLSYEADEDFHSKNTEITAQPYSQYANEHPGKEIYYRPILDALDYKPSHVEFSQRNLIVEGKCDYYVIRHLIESASLSDKFKIIPGTSASSMEGLIALLIGWNCDFLVLLDDDKAGKDERKRYFDLFGQVIDDKIITYSDIDKQYAGFALEKFIGKDLAEKICACTLPASPSKWKKNLLTSAQEHVGSGNNTELTNIELKKISSFVRSICENLNGS